jgi:putative ABC transport system permease protein
LTVHFISGASRTRLTRQALSEALLIAVAGAVAGSILAEILLRIFIAIAPAGIPFLSKAKLDLRIVLFTVIVSLLCGVVFGLISALQRPSSLALAAHSTTFRNHAVLRRVIVTAQIAISLVLLSAAALLLRSFRNLQEQNLGMQTRGVLAAQISLPRYRYPTAQKQMEFFQRAETALRRLPGVTAAGVNDTLPPGGTHHDQIYSVIAIPGKPRSKSGTGGMVTWRWVTPDYFPTLDVPIIRGRGFTEEQRTLNEHFIILSSLLASRLFANEDPVGQRVQLDPDGPLYVVVGVAANVKNAGLAAESDPEYYRLRRNVPEDWESWAAIVLKTTLSPAATAPWVRSQIERIDPTVPVEIETLNERVSHLADRPRFETALLGFFAVSGLLMAIIGLYGVISFIAIQRTQEIGVRMALGARRIDILRLIAWEGVRLTLLGGVAGLSVALAVSHLLRSVLYSVGPYDSSIFLTVTLLLTVVALAATLIPALAAMKVEPLVALRYE